MPPNWRKVNHLETVQKCLWLGPAELLAPTTREIDYATSKPWFSQYHEKQACRRYVRCQDVISNAGSYFMSCMLNQIPLRIIMFLKWQSFVLVNISVKNAVFSAPEGIQQNDWFWFVSENLPRYFKTFLAHKCFPN